MLCLFFPPLLSPPWYFQTLYNSLIYSLIAFIWYVADLCASIFIHPLPQPEGIFWHFWTFHNFKNFERKIPQNRKLRWFPLIWDQIYWHSFNIFWENLANPQPEGLFSLFWKFWIFFQKLFIKIVSWCDSLSFETKFVEIGQLDLEI